MTRKSSPRWCMKQKRLSSEEQRVLRRAKRLGYLLTTGRNPRLASCWAAYCDRNRRPFLKVRVNSEHATVFFDLLQTDFTLTTEARNTIEGLCRLVGGRWHKNTKNFVWGSRIPLEQAEVFARFLVHFVRNVPTAIQSYVSRSA